MPDLDTLHLEAAPGGALSPGNPADDAMLRLLAHMVVSDGVVHHGELGFLSRLLPGKSLAELETWAREKGAGALDVDAIAAAVVDPDLQWKCLRFVSRMAWKDGELAEEEKALLESLATAMSMPHGAVDRVLAEMSPDDGSRYTAERILKILVDIHWDAAQLASGELVSDDLVAVLPAGADDAGGRRRGQVRRGAEAGGGACRKGCRRKGRRQGEGGGGGGGARGEAGRGGHQDASGE